MVRAALRARGTTEVAGTAMTINLIRVIDLETTGIPSELERHAIVEAGWCDVTRTGEGWIVGKPDSVLVNPGRLIPWDAMAIHHIRDADVANAESPDRVLGRLMENADCFSAHNIDFERQFFGGGDKPWVCSYKCALRIWPELLKHQNQFLRYALALDERDDFDPALTLPVHRAAGDAYVSAHILAQVLDSTDFETLVKWSSGPALLAHVTFGKHRGMKWSEVPTGYLQWVISNIDDDRDVRATAKHYAKIHAMAKNAGGGR